MKMNNTKRLYKFNFIDVLIITLLIVSVFVFIFNFVADGKLGYYSDNGKKRIDITVQTMPMNGEYFKNLLPGQPVIEVDSGEIIGYISEFKTVSAESGTDGDKEQTYALITLRCEADYIRDYYRINGKKVLLYREKNYASPELFFTGSLISVSETEHGSQANQIKTD